jgi:hypothetical protein
MNQKTEKNKSDQSKNLVDGRSSNVGEAIKSITEEEKQKLERDSQQLKTHLMALQSANKTSG